MSLLNIKHSFPYLELLVFCLCAIKAQAYHISQHGLFRGFVFIIQELITIVSEVHSLMPTSLHETTPVMYLL